LAYSSDHFSIGTPPFKDTPPIDGGSKKPFLASHSNWFKIGLGLCLNMQVTRVMQLEQPRNTRFLSSDFVRGLCAEISQGENIEHSKTRICGVPKNVPHCVQKLPVCISSFETSNIQFLTVIMARWGRGDIHAKTTRNFVAWNRQRLSVVRLKRGKDIGPSLADLA
jgi:hypothetical protein